MPKYKVTVEELTIYTVEVEAKNASSASKAAIKLFNGSVDPANDFGGEPQGGVVVNCPVLVPEDVT